MSLFVAGMNTKMELPLTTKPNAIFVGTPVLIKWADFFYLTNNSTSKEGFITPGG